MSILGLDEKLARNSKQCVGTVYQYFQQNVQSRGLKFLIPSPPPHFLRLPTREHLSHDLR